jgi:hypothetical protein
VTEADGARQLPAHRAGALVSDEPADQRAAGTELTPLLSWLQRHLVVVAGLALIVAQLGWKAAFLHGLYFRQDDYVDLDRASRSPFNWHYLTLVSSGHLYPGLRALSWVLARIKLYDWGLDSTVLLVLLALACLAALRLLLTLFGERPAILIPLLVYLLIPLTVPDLGWWWAGMESVPFQLAIFLALDAHVRYVRTGRTRHLIGASLSVLLGMLFFEKAEVLPLLLLAVTGGFLMGTRSWLAGIAQTLIRHRRAWLSYAVLMVAYLVLFVSSFRASDQHATSPGSLSAVLSFAWMLLRTSFLPGAVGGPWTWSPLTGGLYAISDPPAIGIWLAAVLSVLVIVVSVALRRIAARAWVTLAGWLLLADIMPVLVGRLQPGWASIYGLETRYVADAAGVLAICLGLAFLPVIKAPAAAAAKPSRRLPVSRPQLGYATAVLVAVFVFGSIVSVREYEADSSGASVPIAYLNNAQHAIDRAGPGTEILNQFMPATMVTGLFEANARQSIVIGDLETEQQHKNIRWVTHVQGTIDNLQMLGSDGAMFPAVVTGVPSVHRSGVGFQACWPEKNGQIKVRFSQPTSIYDWTLKLGYIWSGGQSSVLVEYDGTEESLPVEHGVHSGYLNVTGSAHNFIISGLGTNDLCVASATAGRLTPLTPF